MSQTKIKQKWDFISQFENKYTYLMANRLKLNKKHNFFCLNTYRKFVYFHNYTKIIEDNLVFINSLLSFSVSYLTS